MTLALDYHQKKKKSHMRTIGLHSPVVLSKKFVLKPHIFSQSFCHSPMFSYLFQSNVRKNPLKNKLKIILKKILVNEFHYYLLLCLQL